jgi:hypothetical protein
VTYEHPWCGGLSSKELFSFLECLGSHLLDPLCVYVCVSVVKNSKRERVTWLAFLGGLS